jgi:RES domain-containing protein
LTVTVYRIGYSLAPTLEGQARGSTLEEGRWHTLKAGPSHRRLIYATSSQALAQLEKRVQANGFEPRSQALFALWLPSTIGTSAPLPFNWRHDLTATQAVGNDWLDARKELAIWVPSVVEPAESNLLINVDHPDIGLVAIAVERDPFEFDPRLA